MNPLKAYRVYPDDIAAETDRSVMLFRPSMMRDLDVIGGLKVGRLVVSVWGGYLMDERNQSLLDWLQRRSIPMHSCHTSGHATRRDLHKLRAAFPSASVVPVHTEVPETFLSSFNDVRPLADGQWVPL